MPYDMTMHEPSSRVVRGESYHKPSTGWKHSGISPGRIVEFQSAGGGVTESAESSTEDIEVVAVKMDWVGNVDVAANGLLDDPVSPLWYGLD